MTSTDQIGYLHKYDRNQGQGRRAAIQQAIVGYSCAVNPAAGIEIEKEQGHCPRGLQQPQHQVAVQHERHRQQTFMAPARSMTHGFAVGLFLTESNGGQHIGAEIDGEDLHHAEGQRHRQGHVEQEGHYLGHVTGEHVTGKFLHIGEYRAAFLDACHDRRKIVVKQYHLRCFARDVGAGQAHRHTDVGGTQRGRIIYTVARHRDHATPMFQGADDFEFLLGRGACKHPRARFKSRYQLALAQGFQFFAVHHRLHGCMFIEQASTARNGLGGVGVITGDQHHLYACGATTGERCGHFDAQRIIAAQKAKQAQAALKLIDRQRRSTGRQIPRRHGDDPCTRRGQSTLCRVDAREQASVDRERDTRFDERGDLCTQGFPCALAGKLRVSLP